jgi:hypothetical protein
MLYPGLQSWQPKPGTHTCVPHATGGNGLPLPSQSVYSFFNSEHTWHVVLPSPSPASIIPPPPPPAPLT